ncbi:hypothetical protein DB346_09940 [Verrucomicrobia bacterium LW23]|nr:hypothetical protein DB346_09940 [Verrucomicrobia bacterium LW23]
MPSRPIPHDLRPVRLAVCAMGILGWLAGLGALSAYRSVAAGDCWAPVALAAAVVIADIALRIAFRAGEMPAPPEAWPAPAHVFGLLAAWLTLIVVAVLFVPGIRRDFLLRDHGWTRGMAPLSGGLGLATREQLYRAETGRALLISEPALERRLRALSAEPAAFPPVPWRGDLALVYAALRAQGYSDDKILSLPSGKRIVVGALCAEVAPPYWFTLAQVWLHASLMAEPAGGLRMGWLRPAPTRRLIAQWLARPEQISTQMLDGLIFACGYAPELFGEENAARLFQLRIASLTAGTWSDPAAASGTLHVPGTRNVPDAQKAMAPPDPREAALERRRQTAWWQEIDRTREKLAAFLQGAGTSAGDDGISLLAQADFPAGWTPTTTAAGRDAVARFIAMTGRHVEWLEEAQHANASAPATSAGDTEGAPVAGFARPDQVPAIPPPGAAQQPPDPPLKPDIRVHMFLRSSLLDKVRFEFAVPPQAPATASPGAVPLTVVREPMPEIVVDEIAERVSVRNVERDVVRYQQPAEIRTGQGPVRLPVLYVRLERDGRELMLTLPLLPRVNLDEARLVLDIVDAKNRAPSSQPGTASGSALTSTQSAVLNHFVTRVLLSPWRLNQPVSPGDEDWRIAKDDAATAR